MKNHGAGGRKAADRALDQKTVDDEFVANDILTNCRQYPKDEAPAAYKDFDADFDAVLDSVKSAGITARRSPARSSRKPSSVACGKRQVAVISIGHLFPGWGSASLTPSQPASLLMLLSFQRCNFLVALHPVMLLQNSEDTMTFSPKKAKSEFAKIMAAACVRRGYLERLHCGTTPVTRTGDYSDVKVIDAEGREISWNQVSRINQDEMKTLMTGVVNRIHTFLARTLFSATEDKAFEQALDGAAASWTKAWDEPKYLADFLTPHSEKKE
jgi:hypothetical protein